MKYPRRNLPIAAKRYIYRLVIFYTGSVLSIGVICSYKDAALTDGGAGAKSAAFVVGIRNAGIHGLGSVINAVIILSAWSSGNSFLYISSRSLYSLAIAGNAPRVFAKCTKRGIPWVAVLTSALFVPLAYLNCGSSGSTVFTWFVNLTNTSGLSPGSVAASSTYDSTKPAKLKAGPTYRTFAPATLRSMDRAGRLRNHGSYQRL